MNEILLGSALTLSTLATIAIFCSRKGWLMPFLRQFTDAQESRSRKRMNRRLREFTEAKSKLNTIAEMLRMGSESREEISVDYARLPYAETISTARQFLEYANELEETIAEIKRACAEIDRQKGNGAYVQATRRVAEPITTARTAASANTESRSTAKRPYNDDIWYVVEFEDRTTEVSGAQLNELHARGLRNEEHFFVRGRASV